MTVDRNRLGYETLKDSNEVAHAQEMTRASRLMAGLDAADVRVGTLAADPYLRVERDAVRFPDGSVGLYNRLVVPAGTLTLPILGENVVLIHRYRHGTGSWQLEAPRGSNSHDETPEACARRELAEEIGAQAVDLAWLGRAHSSTGCSNEEHDLFLARINRYGEPDRHESIDEILPVSVHNMEELIVSGAITDGPTLSAFLLARLKRLI